MEWKYKVVKYYYSSFDEERSIIELENILKDMGNKGWELASMNDYLLIFKMNIEKRRVFAP